MQAGTEALIVNNIVFSGKNFTMKGRLMVEKIEMELKGTLH